MVAQPALSAMSVEEYLSREDANAIKHEYVRGYAYAMAGGTLAHDRIANEIRTVLNVHLGDGPCAVDGPDMRVRVAADIYYYPDALVACDPTIGDDAVEVATPRLIVEVLSQGIEADDQGDKFADFQTLPSLEEYLLVDSRRRSVEQYHRSGPDRWVYRRYEGDATLTLESVDLACPVATFYRRTQL